MSGIIKARKESLLFGLFLLFGVSFWLTWLNILFFDVFYFSICECCVVFVLINMCYWFKC